MRLGLREAALTTLAEQLEREAAEAAMSRGLDRVADLATLGALVRNNLPQIIAALRAGGADPS